MPYPAQEQCAVDAVMQLALDKLNFKPENILLFGWSIGGYASSWVAMTYPDIKGLVSLTQNLANYCSICTFFPRFWTPVSMTFFQ